MTQIEWEELNSLKNAITENPASVHPDKLELFTQLFVKSLSYVDNVPIYEVPHIIDNL